MHHLGVKIDSAKKGFEPHPPMLGLSQTYKVAFCDGLRQAAVDLNGVNFPIANIHFFIHRLPPPLPLTPIFY